MQRERELVSKFKRKGEQMAPFKRTNWRILEAKPAGRCRRGNIWGLMGGPHTFLSTMLLYGRIWIFIYIGIGLGQGSGPGASVGPWTASKFIM